MQRNLRLAGFWSALAVMAFTVWFIVAFAFYMPAITNWKGIEAFAQAFNAAGYILWVLPCLFLALSFPILAVCILLMTNERNKLWGIIGLVLASMYGAILTTDYWLLLTIVRESVLKANFNGLSWLIVGSPNSITNSIEGVGYTFMGLSFIFQSFCFSGNVLGKWIRSLLLVNGIATVIAVVVTVIGFVLGAWISLGIWGITFPIIMILIAVYFQKQKQT